MAVGARMDHIVSPFRPSTKGTFTLAFGDIRLVSADGDPTCPN